MTEQAQFEKVFETMATKARPSLSAAIERLERVERSPINFADESGTFRLPFTNSVPSKSARWS